MGDDLIPTADDISAARARIEALVHRTPVMRSRRLDAWAGADLYLKCEHLQGSGAFKLRGATNAVMSLTDADAARGVAAHSSGNHAGALSLAAARRSIECTVVMPSDTAATKLAAVEGYGGRVVLCEPTLAAREAGLAAVLAATGATEIHPYDHPNVIAGAATAVAELLEEIDDLDAVVVPVGGGGLASGTCIAAHAVDPALRIVGAEPAGADDAARSLAAGRLIPQTDPRTIADGLRTGLSERTFGILSRQLDSIQTVSDDDTVEAMRLVWSAAKQIVEPSGAVSLAATRHVDARRIGVIVSGGNVDIDNLPW